MTNNEIINRLKTSVGYDYPNNCIWNIHTGMSEEMQNMSAYEYKYEYYPAVCKIIESLPWISIYDRMPDEPGEYLTLLDCDEHKIVANNLHINDQGEKRWGLYNQTHVKWWIPIPTEDDNEINYKGSKNFNWKDGGQPLYTPTYHRKFY